MRAKSEDTASERERRERCEMIRASERLIRDDRVDERVDGEMTAPAMMPL